MTETTRDHLRLIEPPSAVVFDIAAERQKRCRCFYCKGTGETSPHVQCSTCKGRGFHTSGS